MYNVKTSSTNNSRGSSEPENSLSFDYVNMLDAQVRFLEGELLTIIDATESNAEKREATKSLVKRVVRDRFNYMLGFSFVASGQDAVDNLQTVSTNA